MAARDLYVVMPKQPTLVVAVAAGDVPYAELICCAMRA
jgi:hypothetical protein